MATKRITLDILKNTLRYVFGDLWHKVDLTDYENWVGFTHFCEDVWENLDKRTSQKKNGNFTNTPPPRYVRCMWIPFIGHLYRRSASIDSHISPPLPSEL